MTLFEILFEDAELLVVNKPAGLVCHPTKGDVFSSLISRVRLHLGTGAEPQLLNRLDRETSGVVLVGKTPEVSREIRRQWEQGQVDKRYFAIVCGHVAEARGAIEAPLGPDAASQVAIKGAVRPDGASARTEFDRLAVWVTGEGKFSLLEVKPLTGRKHQIRIHLAHHGHPIVGDKIYGGDENIYLDFVRGEMTEAQKQAMRLPYHALHAWQVRLLMADRVRACTFVASPEPFFLGFLEDAAARALADRLGSCRMG